MQPHVAHSVSLLESAYSEFSCGVFATSSFQTQGVPLLHLISQHIPLIPVWFIDTGFHFAQTHEFVDELRERFSLTVRVKPPRLDLMRLADQRRERGDSDGCCHLMKVKPLEEHLEQMGEAFYKGEVGNGFCWISGVRRDQTRARGWLKEREFTPQRVTRCHPMIDWTSEQVDAYIAEHDLPVHPLHSKGYSSIGCQPCTIPGNGREGRWPGMSKEGCGIHGLLDRETCG
jgi:phosphoadenosine phosphosulfate reductase